eukprot:12041212-Alexandrium_andersonii.AAC.1
MVNTTTSPNDPFPGRRASNPFQSLPMFSLERQLQHIETAAGAQRAQIVSGRAPRVSIFETPTTGPRYGGP